MNINSNQHEETLETFQTLTTNVNDQLICNTPTKLIKAWQFFKKKEKGKTVHAYLIHPV